MTEAKKSSSTLPVVAIAVLVLAAVAYGVFHFFINKPEFSYAGTVEATEIELPARIPSVIATVQVEEGDVIKRDQPLVSLSCDDLKIVSDLNDINFNRVRKLFNSGTVAREQYDTAINRKQDSDVRYGWCTIRSPINGRVLTRYLEPGEWVNPGTKLLSVADLHDIWAYIYVSESTVHSLKAGMKLEGTLPEVPGHTFAGTIRKINAEAEFTPKNVQTQAERERLVFGVKIGFDNPDETLKPGMTVQVVLPRDPGT